MRRSLFCSHPAGCFFLVQAHAKAKAAAAALRAQSIRSGAAQAAAAQAGGTGVLECPPPPQGGGGGGGGNGGAPPKALSHSVHLKLVPKKNPAGGAGDCVGARRVGAVARRPAKPLAFALSVPSVSSSHSGCLCVSFGPRSGHGVAC